MVSQVKMVKINKRTGEEIMIMRESGDSTRGIVKYLADRGVHVSAETVRVRCSVPWRGYANRKPRKLTREVLETVDAILNENDKLSAENVRDLLKTRHNMPVGIWTVKKAAKTLGWKYGRGHRYSKDLSRVLALKTAQLESERKEAAAKVSALEKQHQAEITSLRADIQKRVAALVAANQRLTEALAAARLAAATASATPPAAPTASATPPGAPTVSPTPPAAPTASATPPAAPTASATPPGAPTASTTPPCHTFPAHTYQHWVVKNREIFLGIGVSAHRR